MSGALEGVRILDLTRLVAGGIMGMVLADMGAEVVKVEQPGRGDPLRQWTAEGLPLWWKVYGRNKRSITLNLGSERGRQLLLELLPHFDVLVESFVPGKLEEWDLHYEKLSQVHPDLVMLRISGWGQSGPYSQMPGFGTLIEATSGLVSMSGEPEGAPLLPPFPVGDLFTAMYAASSILAALHHRDVAGGSGQCIEVSIFESLFSMLGPLAAEYAALGRVRQRLGSTSINSAPRGMFKARDEHWIAVSASTPVMAERFLRAYGLGELLEDERFATNEARVRNALELNRLVGAAIAARSLEENLALIKDEQLTAAPVQTIAEIEKDLHWQFRRLTLDVPDDGKTVRMHNVVPRFSSTPAEIKWPGPELGADNELVYGQELGYSHAALAELRQSGVI